MTDHHGEGEILNKFQNSVKTSRDQTAENQGKTGSSDFEPDALIDPIWVAMLTLYIKDNRSMASNKLIQKFTNDISISSVDRYFRFMHEMNLVETRLAGDANNSLQITLTPRAIRLVESGLRIHG